MKTWAGATGRQSAKDEKFSRRFELVGNLRPVTDKSPRRYRIGIADNLFADPNSPSGTQKNANAESTERPDDQTTLASKKELSSTEILIGLAAIAGLTLGYMIGKRTK